MVDAPLAEEEVSVLPRARPLGACAWRVRDRRFLAQVRCQVIAPFDLADQRVDRGSVLGELRTRLHLFRDVARAGPRRDLSTLPVEERRQQAAQIHRRELAALISRHLPQHVLANGRGQLVVDRLAVGHDARC